MAVKTTYNLDDVLPDMDKWLLPRENGMLLSDYQVEVLEKNNINYMNYSNIKELLFAVNEMDLDDEELEQIIMQLDESDYYSHLVN